MHLNRTRAFSKACWLSEEDWGIYAYVNYASIGSHNGLSAYCWLGPREQMTMKYVSKFGIFAQ